MFQILFITTLLNYYVSQTVAKSTPERTHKPATILYYPILLVDLLQGKHKERLNQHLESVALHKR